MSDELYDAVMRIRKEYPELFSLLPIAPVVDNDVYEVLRSLAETATEKIASVEYDFDVTCEGCFKVLDIFSDRVYCENCMEDTESKWLAQSARVKILEEKLANE